MWGNSWQHLLRLSVSVYFILPNAYKLYQYTAAIKLGGDKVNHLIHNTIFACADSYIPSDIAYTLWYGLFVMLGLLILFTPNPLIFLSMAFMILIGELYINYGNNIYGASSILTIILLLVTLALIIFYGRSRRY